MKKFIEWLKTKKFIPKKLIDGKCPLCNAVIQGEPFFCYKCKQALDYSK